MIQIIKTIKVLTLLAVLVGVPAFAVPNFDAPGIAIAIDVQNKNANSLMTKRGVVGTGIGINTAGEPTIKVFVQTQADVAGFPQILDGIPVEVQVTGLFYALHHRPGHSSGPGGGGGPGPVADCETNPSDPKARCDRPVPIGVSTGHPDITAGTIGARVTDGIDVYALSNNHVYANINDASVGDVVIQPGTFDGGSSPADDIGTLFDFVPIDLSGGVNFMDAAIAVSSTTELGNSTPPNGYGMPSANPVTATPNLAVQKFGRTTGLTMGTVDSISVMVDVCYKTAGPFRCLELARFEDQIFITPAGFSAGGDSGSLIVTDDGNNNPVALLFAGNDSGTIASPIQPVLDYFGVIIDATP